MKKLNIEEIIKACNGKLIHGDKAQEIRGFSRDSREIKDGDIYVGIKGENFDGNTYYFQALENGAMGCIIEESYESNIKLDEIKGKSIIIVKDSIKALQDIATYRKANANIPAVAITGSVGKTSTKDIIASCLSEKFNVLKTQGNKNNHIGLPMTVLELGNQEMMVIEMGMNHFGEIRTLTNIVRPQVCVITNIGTSHIGNLGSRENILKAKLEILEGMQPNGVAIVNNDNDLLHKWAEENKANYNIITFGIENKSDYTAYNIKENEEEISYDIDIKEKTYTVTVPVSGKAFVYNSLSALAVGQVFDEDVEQCIRGIKNFELTKKRMEIVKTKGMKIINDSYNASYDSMKSGLEALKNSEETRKIAVLGDMLELGDFAQELHEKVGEEVAKNNIDILVTVGTNAKYIAQTALELGVKEIKMCDNNNEAINYLKHTLTKGDAVLLKASNSMKFGEIFESII